MQDLKKKEGEIPPIILRLRKIEKVLHEQEDIRGVKRPGMHEELVLLQSQLSAPQSVA